MYSANLLLFVDTHTLTENQLRQSGRSNFGQDGATSQLEKVSKDIHSDTNPASCKRKSTLAEMPENLCENNMAPPWPPKRQRGLKAKVRQWNHMSPLTETNFGLLSFRLSNQLTPPPQQSMGDRAAKPNPHTA